MGDKRWHWLLIYAASPVVLVLGIVAIVLPILALYVLLICAVLWRAISALRHYGKL